MLKREGLWVALAAFTLSGCICVVPSQGDLTVFYTFGGETCAAAGVDAIRIDVLGVGSTTDSAALDVDCAAFPEGATIKNLKLGRYEVTIEGWVGNELRYQETFTDIQVKAGDNEYDLDVDSITGTLTLFWTFDGSGACGQVQDIRMMVTAPDGSLFDDARYPCSGKGVTYDFVPPGDYTVSMDGIDGTGRIVYRSQVYTATVVAGKVNEYIIDLAPN